MVTKVETLMYLTNLWQYFVWYLALFPAAFVSLPKISISRWILIGSLWAGAQALWLSIAYRLEFLGESVFLSLWAASLLFFLVNVYIASQFIRNRMSPQPLYSAPGIVTSVM